MEFAASLLRGWRLRRCFYFKRVPHKTSGDERGIAQELAVHPYRPRRKREHRQLGAGTDSAAGVYEKEVVLAANANLYG